MLLLKQLTNNRVRDAAQDAHLAKLVRHRLCNPETICSNQIVGTKNIKEPLNAALFHLNEKFLICLPNEIIMFYMMNKSKGNNMQVIYFEKYMGRGARTVWTEIAATTLALMLHLAARDEKGVDEDAYDDLETLCQDVPKRPLCLDTVVRDKFRKIKKQLDTKGYYVDVDDECDFYFALPGYELAALKEFQQIY